MIVTKIFEFCYGHRLPEHPGKCKQFHGHNAVLEVSVSGRVDPKTGMVIDFGDMKSMVANLIKTLDHKYLNDVLPPGYMPPTAENMCEYIWQTIKILNNENWSLYRIRLYETPSSYVERMKDA